MNCPKCGGTLKVTHTYASDPGGKYQRLVCTGAKCLTVVTAQTLIVQIDPPRGKGAASLARQSHPPVHSSTSQVPARGGS